MQHVCLVVTLYVTHQYHQEHVIVSVHARIYTRDFIENIFLYVLEEDVIVFSCDKQKTISFY
jgi:uncharacterized membrane protein